MEEKLFSKTTTSLVCAGDLPVLVGIARLSGPNRFLFIVALGLAIYVPVHPCSTIGFQSSVRSSLLIWRGRRRTSLPSASRGGGGSVCMRARVIHPPGLGPADLVRIISQAEETAPILQSGSGDACMTVHIFTWDIPAESATL